MKHIDQSPAICYCDKNEQSKLVPVP